MVVLTPFTRAQEQKPEYSVMDIALQKAVNEGQEDMTNEVVRFLNWAANNNDFNFRLSI